MRNPLPTWQSLLVFAAKPLFLYSAGVLLSVPLLARASAAVAAGSSLPDILIRILDGDGHAIPENLVRLYWSSFFLLIAQILIQIFCPKMISHHGTLEKWCRESDEGLLAHTELSKELGNKASDEINRKLQRKFLDTFNHINVSLIPARIGIVIFLIGGIYLLGRVLIEQAIFVYSITTLRKLF